MSVTAESIITSLGNLPRSEVNDVRKHINAMLSLGGYGENRGPDDDTTDAHRVFRIMCEELQAAGLADMRGIVWSRLPSRRNFSQRAGHLMEFIAEQHGARLVQDGILRIGMQLLIRWLREYAEMKGTFIVTPNLVAANIHKIAARLDREFPGYGACGLLHLLIPH